MWFWIEWRSINRSRSSMGGTRYFQCYAWFVVIVYTFQRSCNGFIDVAQEREAEGDLVLGDIGYGMPFRAGSFDGAIR